MFGPVGWQETVFIFILALLLFGPKKLPELGKTVGKAITEFKRASNELKATWDREMSSLERENESLKEVTQGLSADISSDYSYDSSYYDGNPYYPSYDDSTATETSPVGASATQGAEVEQGTATDGTAVASEPGEQPAGEVHAAAKQEKPAEA